MLSRVKIIKYCKIKVAGRYSFGREKPIFTKGYEINMYGSSTAAGIVAGWLASPEHKKIMLKESYNYGEFGVADKNCYDYAYYYCIGSLIK